MMTGEDDLHCYHVVGQIWRRIMRRLELLYLGLAEIECNNDSELFRQGRCEL
jgi:hypothetical protein